MQSTVQRQLGEDHGNVAKLLVLLDREIGYVGDVESADFDLLLDIMRYMTAYPDKVHHPLEDLMFSSLIDQEPESRTKLKRLFREHEELAERGQAFLDTLRLVVDGGLVERAALVEMGRSYSTLLRDHMTYENEIIFPMADRILSEDDWAHVARRFAEQKDPVFGPVIDADFANLLAFIERESE